MLYIRSSRPYLGLLILPLYLFLIHNASATVVVQAHNFTALPDLPASFGPPVPDEGVSGLLVIAEPLHACSRIKTPEFVRGRPWIALIERSQNLDQHCTFDVKVANAAVAGAIAAIIYDEIYEGLILMAKPTANKDPKIPSVFISRMSGELLNSVYVPGETLVYISAVSRLVWISMIISTLAGFLAVSVVISAFYLARRSSEEWREQEEEEAGRGFFMGSRRRGMTQEQLNALPIIIHDGIDDNDDEYNIDKEEDEERENVLRRQQRAENSSSASPCPPRPSVVHTAGDTKRVCVICLEQYEVGDKLRQLPCEHRFHSPCIDQWLLTRKGVCPVCKFDATTALRTTTQGSTMNNDNGTNECTTRDDHNTTTFSPYNNSDNYSIGGLQVGQVLNHTNRDTRRIFIRRLEAVHGQWMTWTQRFSFSSLRNYYSAAMNNNNALLRNRNIDLESQRQRIPLVETSTPVRRTPQDELN